MGLIVTLYLISANVYNFVDAPSGRGFSYIEIWMIGAQFPILLALCEYGIVLYLKKIGKKSGPDLNDWIKKTDIATMIISLVSFFTFFCVYLITSNLL